MVGIFPLVSMFLVTSIAMLRERTTGTLERLMSTPLAKLDLLAGYGIAFAALAVVQAAIASLVAFELLGLEVQGLDLGRVRLAVGECRAWNGARTAAVGVRVDGVPGGPVHAGLRSCRRSCSAACSRRATKWRPCCGGSRMRCR